MNINSFSFTPTVPPTTKPLAPLVTVTDLESQPVVRFNVHEESQKVELNLAQILNQSTFNPSPKAPPQLYQIKSLDPDRDIHKKVKVKNIVRDPNECQSYLHGFCEAGPTCQFKHIKKS